MGIVYIVGIRGIPNRYGGFERLVEVLAPDLVRRGHEVTVFCAAGNDVPAGVDVWQGVRRVNIKPKAGGVLGTLDYDWRAICKVPRGAVVLLFGYGTAVFQLLLLARGIKHCVNMDGIEWRRQKWGVGAKAWLRLNEWIAATVSTELIADHPAIQRYLLERYRVPSRMIAYGVDLEEPHRSDGGVMPIDVDCGAFDLAIARAEPENQLHVVLEAHRRSRTLLPLVVVGNMEATAYGRRLVQDYPKAHFVGAIYDLGALNRLRRSANLYLHGHSVGGTNPSLIEAMAAGAVVIAHDNEFNRWVAGRAARYFASVEELEAIFRSRLQETERIFMRTAALEICRQRYGWPDILDAYSEVVDALM